MRQVCFLSACCGLFLFLSQTLAAQSDSSQFSLIVYADVYTSVSPKAKGSHNLPSYIYSYHRLNEVALNMGLIDVGWRDGKRTSMQLGLMTGTYAQTNLQNEPAAFRMLYEANVSYVVSLKKRITLQAGVFPSHIGLESAIGVQNQTLSRSLQADNSPYYETGIKATHTFLRNKGSLAILLLNGWQQIARTDGQNKPAFGHQFTYTPNSQWVLNSSSFLGAVANDTLKRMRYFHNAWLQYQASERWQLVAGFDLGNDRKGAPQFGGYWWSTIQGIVRYTPNTRWAFAARWERVNDVHQHIFTFGKEEARRIHGYSINADCKLSETFRWRSELRCLKEQLSAPRWMATTSIACLLQKNNL